MPEYNNKTLAEAEKKRRFTVGIEQAAPSVSTTAGDVREPSADELLAEAHTALANADDFGFLHNTKRLNDLQVNLDKIKTPQDTRGALRRITEPLSSIGGAAQLASIPASIAPPIAAALGVGGTLATIPDYLRRLAIPEEGESRPGAMETGGMALGTLPAVKALRSLTKAAPAVAAADLLGGRALAYEGPAMGARPATRPAVAAMQNLASEGIPPGGYHAQDLLENPNAQAVMQREFNANKPVADKVFGRNVDLMGNPKPAPVVSAWEQARQQASMPLETDLTAELDALANKPRPAMSALGKLMERPAFEGLPQGEVAMPKAAPRPSRARPVATTNTPAKGGKSPQQLLNEEALARRRKP